jgi:hypothetical protein
MRQYLPQRLARQLAAQCTARARHHQSEAHVKKSKAWGQNRGSWNVCYVVLAVWQLSLIPSLGFTPHQPPFASLSLSAQLPLWRSRASQNQASNPVIIKRARSLCPARPHPQAAPSCPPIRYQLVRRCPPRRDEQPPLGPNSYCVLTSPSCSTWMCSFVCRAFTLSCGNSTLCMAYI